ncbi:MAG: aspartate aminotransferase family protein [Chloroflexi bacterium]|nr:aspartate aminotransferase family protein [Chloroflexota bacterium]MCH8348827.1 aspartate aminotransferase family protein [Chloroflexota bacterium]MCI0779830.1 aspartate aminotransferase family protein [Chloroflexota bacterium]MCI0792080.1 aspartate aminotransferase family protein [Chloroflexota bacterium]MCI0797911.1 aspartate aminotransferase family protein [Chloroflexota bacterium]
MTSSSDYIAIENQYYAQTVRRQPVVIVRGEGTRVWDADGKEYLDFVAGWAVNNLGHCHPAVTQAIVDQANTLVQTSNQFYTVPQLNLAQILIDNSCLDRVFFGNSGAEANEGALKLARRYGKLHRDGAYEVITAFNSFHGRTMGTLAATGQPHYQEAFTPLLPGFVHVDFNDVEGIMNATTDKTAAVFLEPVQGEGGVNIPDDDYLQRVREWCDQQGLLLMLDEVQTGLGRLGSLFGYQEYGVEPDVITLAKGLGYGVPIGAFLSKEYCMALVPGDHGSTFGGNPLATAAAYAGTKFLIDNDIPAHVTVMGAHLLAQLNSLKSRFSFIIDVRGKGLLTAVEFDSDIAGQVLTHANAAGLLLNAVKPNAIRFMPPLTITTEELDQGVGRFADALAQI